MKKNIPYVCFGIAVIAAIMLTACPTDSGGGGGGNPDKPSGGSYTISLFAGSDTNYLKSEFGDLGYLNGTGTAARFYYPWGLALDGAGNVYVAETEYSRIRKITPGAVVTLLAGNDTENPNQDDFVEGQGAAARFSSPKNPAVDSAGNVYVADVYNKRIRKIDSSGTVTTFAGDGTYGNTNGAALSAQFSYPEGVAVDSAGNVYVADLYNHSIRKIDTGGTVTTFAGDGEEGDRDGPAASARFNRPHDVAVDSAGNVYVADYDNGSVRKISGGQVSTLAEVFAPNGIAVDGEGNIYCTTDSNPASRYVHKITPAGVVTLIGKNESNWLPMTYPLNGVAVNNAGTTIYVSAGNSIFKITKK